MARGDPIGMNFFAYDFQLNCDPLRLEIFKLAPNVDVLRALAMCSTKVLGGMGIIIILSTSQEIMTGREAQEKQIGGDILCYVW
jgi:hypothetical protein